MKPAGSPKKSQAAQNFDAHYQTMLMEEARSFLSPYIRYGSGWGPLLTLGRRGVGQQRCSLPAKRVCDVLLCRSLCSQRHEKG